MNDKEKDDLYIAFQSVEVEHLDQLEWVANNEATLTFSHSKGKSVKKKNSMKFRIRVCDDRDPKVGNVKKGRRQKRFQIILI